MPPVLFVRIEQYESEEYTHPHNILPPLDIGYAIALLEKNAFRSEFIDIPVSGISEKEIMGFVEGENIEFVFIKFTTPSFARAVRLAKRLNRKSTVIGIGQHPSTLPESCIENGFHACIQGEPEEMILKILTENGYRLEGIVYRGGNGITEGTVFEVEDVDALPLLKHELFVGKYNSHYPTRLKTKARWGFILASRGCPSHCIFCSPTLRVSWGKRMRLRGKRSIVDELERLKEMGVNVAYVMDDNLGANKEWLMGLCDELIRRKVGLQWLTQMRADNLDRELICKMKEAGCTTLCIGVESGVDKNLKRINKGQTVEMVRKCFRLAHEHNLLTTAFFLVGVPGETEEEIRKSMELMKELKPDMVQVSFFTAFPGSAAYDDLDQKDDYSSFLHYNKIVGNKSEVSDKRLLELQKEFYRSFYFSPHFMKKYLKTRLLYLISNPRTELEVISKSLRFLIG